MTLSPNALASWRRIYAGYIDCRKRLVKLGPAYAESVTECTEVIEYIYFTYPEATTC